MILTTLGLLISTAGAADVTAVLAHLQYGQPVLQVTMHGRTHLLREVPQPGPSTNSDRSLQGTVQYHAIQFKGMDDRVVNAKTGAGLSLNRGAVTCQGGVALKRCMLWLYATIQESELGTSAPVTSAYVYLVGEKAGVPVLEKSIDVLAAAEGDYNIQTRRCGGSLMIRGNRGGDGLVRYGLVNLENLKFMLMPKGVYWERPDRATPDVAISDSGRIYWQDGSTLKGLDWRSASWKAVRPVGTRDGRGWVYDDSRNPKWGTVKVAHDWVAAVGVGRDDLLVSTDLITFAYRDCTYRVPPEMSGGALSCHVFLDPALGVGVAWLKKNGQVQGSFIRLKDLEEFCPITGRL